MTQSTTVHTCPLCGSKQIKIIEPDSMQSRNGVSYVLRCECGAIVAMTVLKESKTATKDDPSSTKSEP
jgi:hypothetical protein